MFAHNSDVVLADIFTVLIVHNNIHEMGGDDEITPDALPSSICTGQDSGVR